MRSEQAETLKRLANLIAEKNKQHNLTSARTPEEIYKTHINDCVQAFKKAQKTLRKTVIDCGSGAGLPGLVWATLDTNKKIYTVDSTKKKTAFQKFAIRELALENVVAVNDRIQNIVLDQENTVCLRLFRLSKKGSLASTKKTITKICFF